MEELIRGSMHEALDAVQPDVGLRARVLSSLPAEVGSAHRLRTPRRDWMLGAVAVLLAVAVVAALLYARPPRVTVPSESGGHATGRYGLGMVTTLIGWADGPGAHVFRTMDGGRRWTDVTPAGYSSNQTPESFVLDGTHAWLAEHVQSSSSTIVFGTDDGGASWRRSQPISVAGPNLAFRSNLYFIDPTHGWLLVFGTQLEFLYRTTDGGAHWQQLAHATSPPGGCVWVQVVFSSLATGWMACPADGPGLLVSHDGGVSWNAPSLPVPANSLELMPAFSDSLHGTIASEAGLLATTDGGWTWSVLPLPGAIHSAVNFVDAAHGWEVGGSIDLRNLSSSAGAAVPVPLFRTDDGGNTWVPVPTDLLLASSYGQVQDLYFIDPRNGFAIAVTAVPDYGRWIDQGNLLKTADGGVTWTLVGPVPWLN
ncbi:MAG: WD40/YVTN/BNR-like repeat-containing protein [Candidatus Binatia bacterium]